MFRKPLFALLPIFLALSFNISAQSTPTLLVFGDSISAGYGVDASSGWVALLSKRLQAQHSPYQVVNASVSGETTAGGLARLPEALLRIHPSIVLIELGGNDALRGQPLEAMRANLLKMVKLSRSAAAKPVLFEMRIPPNYGPAYTQAFTQSFGDIAKAQKIPMVPFFLASIAGQRDSFQEDGIHPVATAQPKMLEAVWPTLAPLLTAGPASRSQPNP